MGYLSEIRVIRDFTPQCKSHLEVISVAYLASHIYSLFYSDKMLFYTFIVLAVGNTIVYRDQEIDIEGSGLMATGNTVHNLYTNWL